MPSPKRKTASKKKSQTSASVPLDATSSHDLVWQSESSQKSKAHQEFNEALKKHRETQEQVKEVESLIVLVNTAYAEKVYPELEKQKVLMKKRFVVMCEIFFEERVSLTKNQRDSIRRYLMEACYEGLAEDHKFYMDYLERLETKSETMNRVSQKERAEAQIKKEFGVDIDLDELNQTKFDSEEDRKAHEEKFRDFREKFEYYRHKFHEGKGKKKQTKAQAEKERKNLEAEKLLSLDINVLFKSLAKLIHPDTEQDPILRARKLKLMTRLSGARDNMNIAEILEIKMQVDELIPNNQTDVSFNDSTIKRFINIIKSKISELEQTIKVRLYSHPLLEDYRGKALNSALLKKYITKIIKDNQFVTKVFETELENLTHNPKIIKDIIREYQGL